MNNYNDNINNMFDLKKRIFSKKQRMDYLELGYTMYPSKNLVLLFLLVGSE